MTLQVALNKTSKNNQASIRPNNRINLKEGESSSVCFGHMNFMLQNICHTEDTKNEGGKCYNIIILMCD